MRKNKDRRSWSLSKYLSKYLRHRPEELGLALMPGGWVEVDALLAASAHRGFPISREELEEVVARNDKKRFAFDESGALIRAQQGHSAPVDLELELAPPPTMLYHSTPERNLTAILQDGLLKMRRHHVHLSPDEGTARGRRPARPSRSTRRGRGEDAPRRARLLPLRQRRVARGTRPASLPLASLARPAKPMAPRPAALGKAQLPAADDVDVQVLDHLPGVLAVVYPGCVPALRDALLLGYGLGCVDQLLEHLR